MHKLLEKHARNSSKIVAIFLMILTVTLTLQFSTLVSASTSSVTFYAEDTTTQGNWNGTYGSYAHILPLPPSKLVRDTDWQHVFTVR